MYHSPEKPTRVFAPASCMHRIRQFTQLSFAIKVDCDSDLPDMYCPPCEQPLVPRPFPVAPKLNSSQSSTLSDVSFNELSYPQDGQAIFDPWEEKVRRWHPVIGGLTLPLYFGKTHAHQQPFIVQTATLSHGRCAAVGYILSEQRTRLRPDLVSSDPKAAVTNILAAKARGEAVDESYYSPIVSFVCDTSVAALTEGVGPQAELIMSSPVLILECSYLAADMEEEAQHRGHVVWSKLFPLVKDKMLRNRARKVQAAATAAAAASTTVVDGGTSGNTPDTASSDTTSDTTSDSTTDDSNDTTGYIDPTAPYFTLILIHFSLRYSDADILKFFLSETGFESVTMRETNKTTATETETETGIPMDASVAAASGADEDKSKTKVKGKAKTKGKKNGSAAPAPPAPPADIILWLDSGVVELDVA